MVTALQLQEALLCHEMEARLTGDGNVGVTGFSSLFHYRRGTLTFIVPERSFDTYAQEFSPGCISVLLLSEQESVSPAVQSALYVADPRKAFFCLVEHFFDRQASPEVTGISSDPAVFFRNSYIAPSAVLGEDVYIGVGCVIEGNVSIGKGTVIHHQVVIRNGTKIGENCTIFSGAKIGEAGYNYTIGANGEKTMLRHYGGVFIGNRVHIGENVCISRGAIDDTELCDGVKIDALVHIAHNCHIGKNSMILVPTSVSGSVEIGENCHIAADIIRNQVHIGHNALLGLGSVVIKDIPENVIAFGNPAKPVKKRFEEPCL